MEFHEFESKGRTRWRLLDDNILYRLLSSSKTALRAAASEPCENAPLDTGTYFYRA